MKSQAFLRPGFRALALGIALGMGTITASPPAFAQSRHELAKARAAYRQGVSLEAAGDWAGALAKFEQVAQVKRTPQVQFHIARCKENLGRLNEALGDYRMAEYQAKQKKAKELHQITKAREALEARIPKLIITLGAGAESAEVSLDGVQLGEAKLGNQVSVDPGSHHIVVTLSNNKQFNKDVTVKEGETKNVELVPPADLLQKPSPETPSPAELPPEEKPTKKPEKHASAAPWIIGGVGVASLAASGVFYALRASAKSDLQSGCHGNICPESLKSTGDKGKLYSTLSPVMLGVGVVGVGVAVIMLATGGSSSPKADKETDSASRRGVRVDVVQTSSLTGVNVVGRF